MGTIIRAVSGDGFIKLSAAETRDITLRAREIHGLSSVATAALGRTLCAAAILGNLLKKEKASLTLRVNGGGPVGSLIAVSDSAGNVRGYAQNPRVELPPRGDGKPAVAAAVGRAGMLSVSRDLGLLTPYTGAAALVSGDIAGDVTKYFAESEQVCAFSALEVLCGGENTVICAGGYLVQLMPGAPEELRCVLEENVRKADDLAELLRGGIYALAEAVLAGQGAVFLSETHIEYICGCRRERVFEALTSIGEADLRSMIESGESAHVCCQFCDSDYDFTPAELSAALDKWRIEN